MAIPSFVSRARIVLALLLAGSATAIACGSSADATTTTDGGSNDGGPLDAASDATRADGEGASDGEGVADATDGGDAADGATCGRDCAVRLAVGYSFACAVFGDGKVRCWGDNTLGTTGQALSDGGLAGMSPVAVEVPGLSDVVDVAAGAANVCALTKSGAVLCWGGNERRQIAPGDGGPDPHPTPVPMPLPGEAAQLSVGFESICARLVDGRVYCRGDDRFDQLGVAAGATDPDLPVVSMPTPMEGLVGADDVSVQLESTCVIVDGGVRCVGDDSSLELDVPASGRVKTLAEASLVLLPARATRLSQASFSLHRCAIFEGGGLTCWGTNLKGAAAPASLASPVAPTPVPVPSTANVKTAFQDSCAATENGDVYCWGANEYGQLAQPDDAGTANVGPVKVALAAPAKSAGAGNAFACALLTTGRVVCWGANFSYGLGRGDAGLDENLIDPVPADVAIAP